MDEPPSNTESLQDFADRIRNACIQEAVRAYEDAGISGLCHEGRFEAAISAMRVMDLGAHRP